VTEKKPTFKDVISSKGMEFINRSYSRSVTRYIFTDNADKLIQHFNDHSDPIAYSQSVAEGTKPQVMREAARLLHNFLAGASTLIDQTRVFISDHYLGTDVNKEFKSRIDRNFLHNPLSQFVKDLRNFMMHCGLPPVERHLTMARSSEVPSGTLSAETGFRLRKAELQKWDAWKADSKHFLEQQGDFIDLMDLVVRYRILIDTFHNEFDALLQEHHKDDLAKFAVMQDALAARERREP
jgi:hypothetical protein